MRKRQTKIDVMECGCLTTDSKNGIVFGLKATGTEEAKGFLPTYDAIVKIKDEAIKRIDNKIDTMDMYIDTYNSLIKYLELCTNLKLRIPRDDRRNLYNMIIYHMFVLQHFKIIPTDKWHYFQLNI